MTSVVTRIFLRYLAAILVTKGVLAPDMGDALVADPEVAAALQVAFGTAVGLLAEGWYVLARKFGWQK